MLTNNVAPMTRTVTLGFVPPPRFNVPSTISFTDTDRETGERSTIPVTAPGSVREADSLFSALEKLSLIELASRLDVDWNNVPSWVPKVDEAISANLLLTEGELYERLLADIEEEGDLDATGSSAPAGCLVGQDGGLVHLPSMFTKIGVALEDADKGDTIRRAFMGSAEETQSELVEKVVESAKRPLHRLTDLFAVRQNNVELSELQMGARYLTTDKRADPVGEIDDIAIATCLAWTTNMVTSTDRATGKRVGFWLCDRDNNQLSKVVSIDVNADSDGVRFQLPLSVSVGRSDLEKLNKALSKLSYWA